jgi:hypothetical protein
MSLRDYYNDYYFGYANLPDTKERQKLYYKWNKERIKSNQSIWRKYNREYPKIWKKSNPDYFKIWYQNNRERLLKNSKEYYRNKELVSKKKKMVSACLQ